MYQLHRTDGEPTLSDLLCKVQTSLKKIHCDILRSQARTNSILESLSADVDVISEALERGECPKSDKVLSALVYLRKIGATIPTPEGVQLNTNLIYKAVGPSIADRLDSTLDEIESLGMAEGAVQRLADSLCEIVSPKATGCVSKSLLIPVDPFAVECQKIIKDLRGRSPKELLAMLKQGSLDACCLRAVSKWVGSLSDAEIVREDLIGVRGNLAGVLTKWGDGPDMAIRKRQSSSARKDIECEERLAKGHRSASEIEDEFQKLSCAAAVFVKSGLPLTDRRYVIMSNRLGQLSHEKAIARRLGMLA